MRDYSRRIFTSFLRKRYFVYIKFAHHLNPTTRCELLKSLVLPGLGAFTIVDERKVGGEDVGNNFFLDPESMGENRGAVATRLLVEMNHEVRGDAVEESPEDILRNKPGTYGRGRGHNADWKTLVAGSEAILFIMAS